MALYTFSHYHIEPNHPQVRKAMFNEVRFIEGEVRRASARFYEMDLMLFPEIGFDSSNYYEIAESNESGKLSTAGWRLTTLPEIIESDNVNIAAALAKGENPLPLTPEQEAHNKSSIEALSRFMKRKDK